MMQARDFSKTGDAMEIPNLAKFQVDGCRKFLQPDCLPEERGAIGLEALFREVLPARSSERQMDVRRRIMGSESVKDGLHVGEVRGLGKSLQLCKGSSAEIAEEDFGFSRANAGTAELAAERR